MKYILLALTISSIIAHPFLQSEYYANINSVQSTWTAGHNKRWEQFSYESIRTQMGTIMDVPEELQLPVKEVLLNGDLPENFDSRTAWPQCESIQEVRDQSECGSCWAFGAAEAMSDRLCIATGSQDRISTEDLLTCCGFTCGFGCNGGFPGGAWSYFKSQGLVTGNEYGNTNWCKAYTFEPCEHHTTGEKRACDGTHPTPKCVKECHNESGRDYQSEKAKYRASDSFSLPRDEQSIMHEIMTNGPVEGAFTVYEDFLTYKSGVYQHVQGKQLGGHAIKVLGWGVENGVKYWLCANSWNEDWGDQGFFKILRGSNHCGIEGQMVAGTVGV